MTDTLPPLPAELAEFRAWKADREEHVRTRGKYALTPEGRAEIRHIFDSDDWTFALLDEVERLEAALQAGDALDARRYRWLRADCNAEHPAWRVINDINSTPEQIDATIDASIASEGAP